MDIQKADLDLAVARQILTTASRDALWQLLEECQQERPSFRGAHILYYLGGVMAIGAFSLFMTLGWELFGGWGLCGMALGMGVGTLGLTRWLLESKGLPLPAGILLALTVALVPLAIYGLQSGLGFWSDAMPYRAYHTRIDWRWLIMELGTLAAAAILLWRFRLPFAVLPVAVTLWYMGMDLLPAIAGQAPWSGTLARTIAMGFGLGMILLALWIDLHNRSEKDFAFWLYLFGAMSLWGGLSLFSFSSELGKFYYGCLNTGMVFLGGVLRRRVFAVFGGLGLAGYLLHLSYTLFVDSMLFPFILAGLGLGLVYAGIVWQRHEAAFATRCQGWLPVSVREMLVFRSTH
ncbi:MAG: hypothetical protein H7836_07600 [Magnetococcus sp. YQC-3]